jgi:hypothetical protein
VYIGLHVGSVKEMSVNKPQDVPMFIKTVLPTTTKWSGPTACLVYRENHKVTVLVSISARKSNLNRIHRAFDPTGYIAIFSFFCLFFFLSMQVKALSSFFRHTRERGTCLWAAEEWGRNVRTYWRGCIILGDDTSLWHSGKQTYSLIPTLAILHNVAVVVTGWPLIAEAQVQSFSFSLSLSFHQRSILINYRRFLLNNTYK